MTAKRKRSVPQNDLKEPVDPRPKRPVGLPSLELHDPILDTQENIARVVLKTKPEFRGE